MSDQRLYSSQYTMIFILSSIQEMMTGGGSTDLLSQLSRFTHPGPCEAGTKVNGVPSGI